MPMHTSSSSAVSVGHTNKRSYFKMHVGNRMAIVELGGYLTFGIGLLVLCADVYYGFSEGVNFRWSIIVMLLSAVLMGLSKIHEVLLEIRDK